MTASCADLDSHWRRYSLPVHCCDDSHALLSTGHSDPPCSYDHSEGLAAQAPKLAAAVAVRLDADNVDQGYHTAGHREEADGVRKVTLFDAAHTGNVEGLEGSWEVAYEGREEN
jgi:hypothetical protein